MSAPARPYLSNGQVLQRQVTHFLNQKDLLRYTSPPLSARLRNLFDDTYAFLGLYVTTLFSVR